MEVLSNSKISLICMCSFDEKFISYTLVDHVLGTIYVSVKLEWVSAHLLLLDPLHLPFPPQPDNQLHVLDRYMQVEQSIFNIEHKIA